MSGNDNKVRAKVRTYDGDLRVLHDDLCSLGVHKSANLLGYCQRFEILCMYMGRQLSESNNLGHSGIIREYFKQKDTLGGVNKLSMEGHLKSRIGILHHGSYVYCEFKDFELMEILDDIGLL